jgi:abortive infection bacteriophage resistance protein
LRNLSAHSDRVWNRRMTKKVRIKWFEKYFWGENNSLFAYVVVICYLLRIVAPWSTWFGKFEKLIDTHKSVPLAKMGFSENWKEIVREKEFMIGEE